MITITNFPAAVLDLTIQSIQLSIKGSCSPFVTSSFWLPGVCKLNAPKPPDKFGSSPCAAKSVQHAHGSTTTSLPSLLSTYQKPMDSNHIFKHWSLWDWTKLIQPQLLQNMPKFLKQITNLLQPQHKLQTLCPPSQPKWQPQFTFDTKDFLELPKETQKPSSQENSSTTSLTTTNSSMIATSQPQNNHSI